MLLSGRQKRRVIANIAQQIVLNDLKRQRVESIDEIDPSKMGSSPADSLELEAYSTSTQVAAHEPPAPGTQFEDVTFSDIQVQGDDTSDQVDSQVGQEESSSEGNSDDADDDDCSESSTISTVTDCSFYEVSDTSTENDDDATSEVTQTYTQQMGTALFPGSSVSANEFSAALLSIFLKHDMSYQCVSDVLKLFQYTIPSPNLLPQSHNVLIGQLIKYDEQVKIHYCCSSCSQALSLDTVFTTRMPV